MRTVFLTALATSLAVPPFLQGQTPDDSEWNHFSTEARLAFNIRAKFQNVGGIGAVPPPPPSSGGAVDRTYGDGFVKVDSSGNQGGLSWNWGYKNASQVPGNDTVQFHASTVTGVTTSQRDDPSLGFDVAYVRDFGHETWGRWGLKTAFGYNSIHLEDRQVYSADVSQVTDSYSLHGLLAPLAPYTGSFQGPGIAIGSTPTRSIQSSPGGAQISGHRSVDADLYQLHLGPQATIWFSDRLALEVSAGLALGIVDSTLSFSETVVTGDSTRAISGAHQDTGILAGAYVDAVLSYRFWRSASVFGGVGFESLGTFNSSAGPRSVQLDLSETVVGLAGVRWSF